MASFVGWGIWLCNDMGLLDGLIFSGINVLCLPIIFPQTTPRFLACLGGVILGLIAGMQLVDLCFDIVIIRDHAFFDGVSLIPARKVAYIYYHTVLNAPHVNAVLLGIIVVSFLGSFVGLGRSDPKTRAVWIFIGCLMAVGVSAYLLCVVTRYLGIRSSKIYDPLLFEGWGYVMASRLVLYATMCLAFPPLFSLQAGNAVANCRTFQEKPHEG